ncbi:MAG: cytochrome ubiquinol oxidase subunit I [Gammaproteobacteria bacterium]|nr:cytochrome ubiquinol oxidase subunit I [Pseudomonadales bacterium]
MELDPVLLARIQFAANISFHILFPTITIGLSWVLLYFRIRYTRSLSSGAGDDPQWEEAYQFWVRIFALSFALGVVSGVTMSFQFGTNWPGFMDRAGNIAGPLLGYEVLTAFFLEASFLGIMLFGKHRVSNRIHLLATTLVAVGTLLSAFWILALNAWMQTPAGFTLENAQFQVDSWAQVLFNPSFPYRFVHTLIASLLTTAFLITGVSAFRYRRGLARSMNGRVLRSGIVMAALLSPLQILVGDLHGLNTLEYQPAKVAAIEAVWKTERGAPFTLLGIPDSDAGRTRMAIRIPNAASLILTHDWDGEVRGLNEFIGEHPPVAPVFWAFRIMLGVGVLMVTVSWWACWTVFRRRSYPPLLLKILSLMTYCGWIAVLAGWYVSEIGRQPWMVYGQLKTATLVASQTGSVMSITLLAYLLLYGFLLVSYFSVLRYLASRDSEASGSQQQAAMKPGVG